METKEKKAAIQTPIKNVGGEIFGPGGFLVARVTSGPGGTSVSSEGDRASARAAYIVRAVNDHESNAAKVALFDEMKALLERLEHADFFADSGRLLREDARALLAKIKG